MEPEQSLEPKSHTGLIVSISALVILIIGAAIYTLVERQAQLIQAETTQLDKVSSLGVTASTSNTITTNPVNQYQNVISSPVVGGTINEDGYTHDVTYKPNPSRPGAVLNDHLIFISPTGEKLQIPDDIWAKIDFGSSPQAGPDNWVGQEHLESFDMPINPENEDIIFLSTVESLDRMSLGIINRIYSYNLKTTELKELYSETVYDDSSPGVTPQKYRVLRTVGIDGSKVVVLYDPPGNSPGPCTSIWSDYKDQMGYLELADIQSGLQSYTVPTSKVLEGELFVQWCLNEFETNGGI